VEVVDSVSLLVHGIGNGKQPHVSGSCKCLVEISGFNNNFKTFPSGVDLTDGFLQTLLKCSSNSHDFTDQLHGRANLPVYLIQEAEMGDDAPGRVNHHEFKVCPGASKAAWK
jgi:hypothetical protein